MKTTFISTSSISAATRLSLMKVQQQLADAQQEMTSGRFADVGKALGFKTGQSISLRQEQTRLNSIIETNTTVSSRLEASQAALENLVSNAQLFVDQALASRSGGSSALVIKEVATSSLETFADTVNTSFGGTYLFSGVNTDAKPIADYYTTPTSASQQGVANAFLAAFGISQSSPTAVNISAAAMQAFLDTPFSDLFADPSWITDWSSASNQNVRNRISTNELIETSVNANDDAFRQLAKAYTMVADLGVENLNRDTYEAVINQAMTDASEAIQKISQLQSSLGVAQQRVSDASERMTVQMDIIAKHVVSLEGVDPNEASTRVTELLTQVETSYALTARIMGLSILNYL
jgi:flagellar hook-associated protein 3 FlgL